jgi:hypothetical protein
MVNLQAAPRRMEDAGMWAISQQRVWRQAAKWLFLLIFSVAPVFGQPPAYVPASDSNGGTRDRALVEFRLPNREAIDQLVALGADLAEYLRENGDGSVTVNAVVTPAMCEYYESLGFEAGVTIEDRSTWDAVKSEREATIAAERRSLDAAEEGRAASGQRREDVSATGFDRGGEVLIMRVDYFTNYTGRFLSVAARTSLGTSTGGPALATAWKEHNGGYGPAFTMARYVDADQYMYHRILVRMGTVDPTASAPDVVRVASSTGAIAEGPVNTWVGGGLPPVADGYLKGFVTHYMDPIEVRQRINALAAEFPDLAEIIDLPHLTNGYQRKAMATLAGTTAIGATPSPWQQPQAVVLFSRAWGHEGGNDVQAELLDPRAANSPLAVTVAGTRISVRLATDSTGALASTAAQVAGAINNDPAAGALVAACTWAGDPGAGIVQPKSLVNLSDFLNAPSSIPRGPFQGQMLRIGKHRDGSRVGVFLYGQQHAREWTTPLVCIETAERLLRNYAIDSATQSFVDNLDIFIVPTSNPDGALYSFYDFNMQRKNLTNYGSRAALSGMPPSRDLWGVDLNRNSTVGSVHDGYEGASLDCLDELYAGPSEASEPEIQNELWIVDTYTNIKFASNIHSYGGYFMWSPGAYVAPGRVTLPEPNIGVEAYFFSGADLILNRIKEERGTVVFPDHTGPITDVLYSAAGSSVDDQWYRKGIISFGFETGADRFVSTPWGLQLVPVGFQPVFATEGFPEAMEFASGSTGLLEMALQYAFDNEPPMANIVPDGGASQTPIRATFEYVDEPAVIYYTLDGSTPTTSSPMWEATGLRQPGQVFLFDQTTTIQWIAQDIKGNLSDIRAASFIIEPPLAATTALASVNGW